MSEFGDKPFGLRQVKLMSADGGMLVALPAAQVLTFKERVRQKVFSGEGRIVGLAAKVEAVDWELGAGGLPLEAYALMTGRTVEEAGAAPSRTATLTAHAGEGFPFFTIYGRSLGEGEDDLWVKIFSAKVTKPLDGVLANGAYLTSGVSGVAVDDGVNGIYETVQNETAVALPEAWRTFYVDDVDGDDSAHGESIDHAWKTLAKVNSYAYFVSGDKVRFKCGGTWSQAGGLVVAHEGMYIGNYGSGALPILTDTTTPFGRCVQVAKSGGDDRRPGAEEYVGRGSRDHGRGHGQPGQELRDERRGDGGGLLRAAQSHHGQ